MVAEPGHVAMENMEAGLQAINLELIGIANMNIPTFTRTIDSRMQSMEGTVGSIMDIDHIILIPKGISSELFNASVSGSLQAAPPPPPNRLQKSLKPL